MFTQVQEKKEKQYLGSGHAWPQKILAGGEHWPSTHQQETLANRWDGSGVWGGSQTKRAERSADSQQQVSQRGSKPSQRGDK